MMKLHRIFIAITLPDEIKERLLAYTGRWPELPARWVREENLHLTLAFLGNTSEAELRGIITICERVGERHNPFLLSFTKIVYGPDEKRPKMIWALIEKSPELLALQKDLEHALASVELYTSENRPYSPHLTLARFNMMQFRQMEPEERPEIKENSSLTFLVESIEIMESTLRRSGAHYSVVQSFVLQRKE